MGVAATGGSAAGALAVGCWPRGFQGEDRQARKQRRPRPPEREDCTPMAWYRYFTHLAREGRMTVIIGRRELLAALGGAVVAWPLAASALSGIRATCFGVRT
jgi:hypothetical protein